MFIERIPTGVFGVSTVGAGPALGMATPWPATKSPVPPAQVRLAEPEVVLQLMVGGVAAPAKPPKRVISIQGFGPLGRKSASIFCGAVKVFGALVCAPLPGPSGPISVPVSSL